MKSRMDRYNTSRGSVNSRTEKNKQLYEDVRNSVLTDFDVNSNVSIIEENAGRIDVGKVKKYLHQHYSEDAPKRKSIEVPKFDEPIIEDTTIQDTKEYDINAILAKAKEGKNVDYSKERLKKVRDTQFEILNNLDLELKKVEEKDSNKKEQEDNLINLINTITEIEKKNKEYYSKAATSEALDLLSDLSDDKTKTNMEVLEEVKEELKKEEKVNEVNEETEKKEEIKEEKTDESLNTRERKIEKTLSKLNININSFEDFADVSKKDTAALILKLIIFVFVFALIIGALIILNNILGLGLF